MLLHSQNSADPAKTGRLKYQKLRAGGWQDTPESHSRWRAYCHSVPVSCCKQANHLLVASITALAAHTIPLLMIPLGELTHGVLTFAAASTKNFAAACTKAFAAACTKTLAAACIKTFAAVLKGSAKELSQRSQRSQQPVSRDSFRSSITLQAMGWRLPQQACLPIHAASDLAARL